MRVIAGQAKGHRLKGPRGRATRPTSDRVREAMFAVLASLGADLTRVLDLYAGSGALGIEALSRGARWCDFVEQSPAACAIIRDNLLATGLQASGQIHCTAVERAVPRLQGPCTLILADPPYSDDSALAALSDIASSPLVAPGVTILVLEHEARRDPPEHIGPLALVSSRRHGDTAFSIYR